LTDPSAVQALEEGMKSYDEIELGTQAMAFSLGDLSGGILRTVTVTEMKPPEKIRDISRKTLKAVDLMNVGDIKQQITMKEDAENVGDVKVDLMTVTQDLPADNPGAAFQKQLISSMYGPEGMTTRIAYLSDVVVQTLGGGSGAMSEAIQALAPPKKTGAAATTKPTAGLAGTRAKLAPTANLVFMIDLASMASDGLRMAGEALGPLVPVQPDQIKKLNIKRSYLGMSVGAESTGVRVKGHAPFLQLSGFVKLGNVLKDLIPPGGIPGIGPRDPAAGGIPPATRAIPLIAP